MDLANFHKKHKDKLTHIHRADFYGIIWFQTGTTTLWIDFAPVEVKPNTLVFLNKGVVQRFEDALSCTGKIMLFTDGFFCQSGSDTRFLRNTILFNDLFSIPQVELAKQTLPFADLLKQMEAELQRTKDDYQADILRNLLHNFLLNAEREKRQRNFTEVRKGANLDYVTLFKDSIEKDFAGHKLVSYYATCIAISEKRLNQATTAVLGKTPKQMIDERVMLEAKRLLAYTTESIKEIGFRLGFDEPTNFIKYFKKHNGSTPVEFRELQDL